jgi:hypothetical protein
MSMLPPLALPLGERSVAATAGDHLSLVSSSIEGVDHPINQAGGDLAPCPGQRRADCWQHPRAPKAGGRFGSDAENLRLWRSRQRLDRWPN